jgi:SAM-dependent methyltransferase
MPQLTPSRVPGATRDGEGAYHVPIYLELGDDRVLASFGRALGQPESVEIRRERARSYPGLSSAAPRTDAIYRAFAPEVKGRTVLDIGCGSAAGLAQLEGAARYLGVDSSELALRFARACFPGAQYRRLDATRDELPEADVALAIDVLGHARDPLAVLRRAAAAVGEGGRLCLAEPSANIAQELIAPVVRAFSRPELVCLLEEAGFVAEQWLSEGRFWVTVARREVNEWTRGLEAADQLVAAGLVAEACDLLRAVPRSDAGALEASWFLRLFQTYEQLGQGDLALGALMEGHRRAPEDARLLFSLAESSHRLEAHEDAERFARAAVERDPASSAGHRVLAQAMVASGGQVARLSAAVKLDPSNVELAASLAIAAADAQLYSIGILALERVREYHSVLSADFHLTLGWLYLVTGQVDEALLECKLAGVVDAQHSGIEDLMFAICEARPSPLGLA